MSIGTETIGLELSTMRDFIRRRLGDTRTIGQRHSDNDLLQEINDATNQLLTEMDSLGHVLTSLVGKLSLTIDSTVDIHPLPPDFFHVYKVLRTDTRWVIPCHEVPDREIEEWSQTDAMTIDGGYIYAIGRTDDGSFAAFKLPPRITNRFTGTVDVHYIRQAGAQGLGLFSLESTTVNSMMPSHTAIIICLRVCINLGGPDRVDSQIMGAFAVELARAERRLFLSLHAQNTQAEVDDVLY